MENTEEIRRMLNETPLFSGCASATLGAIAELAEKRQAHEGEVIYEAGSEAGDVFVLVKGLVRFKTETSVGHLYNETLMKRYMIFGWAALIPDHPRRLGSATCLEDSELLSMNGDKLLEVLANDPQSGFAVMKRLCSMIAATFIDKR